MPSPKAPSVIAVNKKTGKLVWEDNSVGEKVLHGQWSSPAVGQGRRHSAGRHRPGGRLGPRLRGEDRQEAVGVRPEPEGLGLAEDAQRGHQHAGHSTKNVVYIANGQDPEHGEGVGHLYAIDPTKRGDITETGRLWHYDKIRRSISTGAIYNGILFYSDFSGFLHALDIKTGKPFWTHDMFAAIWGSPMVIDGKVYLGDEDGDITILAADRTLKVVAENNMGSSVYSTPVPANGTLFMVNRNQLIALAEGASRWTRASDVSAVRMPPDRAALLTCCLLRRRLTAQRRLRARDRMAAVPRLARRCSALPPPRCRRR